MIGDPSHGNSSKRSYNMHSQSPERTLWWRSVECTHVNLSPFVSKRLSARNFPGLTEVPSAWVNWPVVGFFFEDSLANHWQPLLAIGNIDNEPLALQVSFYDKLIKLRELLLNVYGSVQDYRAVAVEAKKKMQRLLNKIKVLFIMLKLLYV